MGVEALWTLGPWRLNLQYIWHQLFEVGIGSGVEKEASGAANVRIKFRLLSAVSVILTISVQNAGNFFGINTCTWGFSRCLPSSYFCQVHVATNDLLASACSLSIETSCVSFSMPMRIVAHMFVGHSRRYAAWPWCNIFLCSLFYSTKWPICDVCQFTFQRRMYIFHDLRFNLWSTVQFMNCCSFFSRARRLCSLFGYRRLARMKNFSEHSVTDWVGGE